jgi:hypothetical protein
LDLDCLGIVRRFIQGLGVPFANSDVVESKMNKTFRLSFCFDWISIVWVYCQKDL